MIVFTATLSLIIAAVVALARVAAGRGSTHSLGDDFVLAGHHLNSLSAGRLFLYGIVVGIAGLPGFSVSGSAAQMAVGRNSGRCGTVVRRCPASGVTAGHHGGEPCPGRHLPRQRLDQRACGRPQPCDRLGECRSPEPERTALNRPGVRRDTHSKRDNPSKKERR